MSENYWGTKVPVARSETELRKLVQEFGAEKYAVMEDWKKGSLVVMFEYHGLPIRFELDVTKIVERRLEEAPFNNYRRKSEEAYIAEIQEKAKSVGMRILVAQVKASLIAIEYGIFTVEEVFLSHFVTKTGRTLGQEILSDLPGRLMNPERLLGSGR
jgi:hypothetical protein